MVSMAAKASLLLVTGTTVVMKRLRFISSSYRCFELGTLNRSIPAWYVIMTRLSGFTKIVPTWHNHDMDNSSTPSWDIDFYSDEVIKDPFPVYERLRELGPVVYLPPNELLLDI